jgi:hypothetical protein
MLKPFVVWPKYRLSKISANLHDASQYTTKELDGGVSNDKMDQKVLVLHSKDHHTLLIFDAFTLSLM